VTSTQSRDAGDKAALAQAAARGDTAAGGAAALHFDDPGFCCALECRALLRGSGSRAAKS